MWDAVGWVTVAHIYVPLHQSTPKTLNRDRLKPTSKVSKIDMGLILPYHAHSLFHLEPSSMSIANKRTILKTTPAKKRALTTRKEAWDPLLKQLQDSTKEVEQAIESAIEFVKQSNQRIKLLECKIDHGRH